VCPLRRVDRDQDVASRRFDVSLDLNHDVEDMAHHNGYVRVEFLECLLI
jgi:hypothetical protein